MIADDFGADPALAKAEPVSRLGRSGFDPGELMEDVATEIYCYFDNYSYVIDEGLPLEDCRELAGRILAIPRIDPTPTRQRVLIALGGLRDGMTPQQVRTVQWFAEQLA